MFAMSPWFYIYPSDRSSLFPFLYLFLYLRCPTTFCLPCFLGLPERIFTSLILPLYSLFCLFLYRRFPFIFYLLCFLSSCLYFYLPGPSSLFLFSYFLFYLHFLSFLPSIVCFSLHLFFFNFNPLLHFLGFVSYIPFPSFYALSFYPISTFLFI